MENMMNELDEMVLSPAEQAIMDKNLARTKGFLMGVAVVGAGVGLNYLFKKIRKRKIEAAKAEKIDQEEEV